MILHIEPIHITAGVAGIGLAGNAIWTVVNLKMQAAMAEVQAAIGAKIDGLRDWMAREYTAVPAFEACQQLCGERMVEICRRLDRLEGIHPPAPLTPMKRA